MKTFEIWSEGYVATGERAGARLHGTATGEDFRSACIAYFKTNPSTSFNAGTLTYWGCRLFDNEVDARKAYG